VVVAVAAAEQELETVRRRGFGVAYRMLGSVTEAEDVAQEAMFRFARTHAEIDEPLAWITTVATRLSIDQLRLARVRREQYVGPWLPEPLIDEHAADAGEHAELADSLSQAFLVVLERLTPVERAAFLLREVFDYDYPEVAKVINRTEANTRQLVVRAKKHLEASHPRFDADEAIRDRLLERFLAAAEAGDIEGLAEMLAEDAAFYSDGGGKVIAARKPLFGGARIARAAIALARPNRRRRRRVLAHEFVTVGGQPGRISWTPDGKVYAVISIDVVAGKIQTIRVVRNPDKLRHLNRVIDATA
jgi:RNA polymerase sigma-70 factor (ECF subfamily)